MFTVKKIKINVLFLLIGFVLQFNSSANAAYDVFVAKTIDNKNDNQQEQEVTEEYMPTYNDPDIPDMPKEGTLVDIIEKKATSFFNRKKAKKAIEENIIPEQTSETSTKEQYGNPTEAIEDSNKFTILADKITYDETEGNVYAHGNIEINATTQGVTLKSDEAVLNKSAQTLKLSGNVKILKEGSEISGEYMLIDLNEQNILMDNPVLKAYQFIVKAQQSFLVENNIQMLNGTLTSEKQKDIVIETHGFQRYENISAGYINDVTKTRDLEAKSNQVYDVKSKEMILTSYKDHNSIVLKDTDIYYKKHKLINNADIEIISDKQRTVTETNAPEAGNFRNYGMYIGYGFVFKLPQGQTLKVIPTLTHGNKRIGVGAIARHRSRNSLLEAGYNTSTENLVVNGKYNFGNGFSLAYGRKAYMPEGFLGARRSGYAAQLQFQKSYVVKDLDAYFNQGFYAGAFSDYVKHKQEHHAYATTRFRYMAELRKDFFKYKNNEQDFGVAISGRAQGAATVYGSGETTGIVRVGPFLTTHLKKWESGIGYLLAGVHGDSPFVFDKYRYGKSSIMVNEKFNFNNKFALGFRATISPKKDNYEHDLLTESRLYAIFGPQDLKLCVSYDFVRDVAHIDLLFLLGTNSSKMHFDKFTTKDADKKNQKDFYKSKPVKIEVPENI